MHRFGPEMEELARRVIEIALQRRRADPPPLNCPRPPAELGAALAGTITEAGIGPDAALHCFERSIVPATIAGDHPRFLAFIPHAPTEASILGDWLLSAFPSYAGSWLEGAGIVQAENEVLRWLADCAGFPETAGGCFVQGGTAGNLAALHAAREAAKVRDGGVQRWSIVASAEVHASIHAAAKVMDLDVIDATADAAGRLSGDSVRAALTGHPARVCAVVASAGATNLGVIDDLTGIAEACAQRGVWFHVDGAYGLGVLAAPRLHGLIAGLERADSFIVDPHKWLFAPYDCCALIYRDPVSARLAHAQHAAYLEAYDSSGEWHPSDYAVHLTRRGRGFPLWFSLAVHGTRAYAEAIERAMEIAREIARSVKSRPYLELVREPELTVVVFKRRGWSAGQYKEWSDDLLASGTGLVLPSRIGSETVLRMVALSPNLRQVDIDEILDSLGRG